MAYFLKPGTAWADASQRCLDVAPESFHEERVLNLWGGRWRRDGDAGTATSPVDGTAIAAPPLVSQETAQSAVRASLDQHRQWRDRSLADRKARVAAAVGALEEHRDLLSLLLVWEIGKPWQHATSDVDRCISGTRWYVDEIDAMIDGRAPLDGPVSNIASWNYPMSVLMHQMLVQMLSGNAAIAKVPTDGGASCLTLASALAAREGLPVTLLSGSGSQLSPALVRSAEIGCVSFVGGRDAGARVAADVVDTEKPHILEQEGLNCWGIWQYSDWETLRGQIHKTFGYAKQRCTAYPRFVVQRSLFDEFLATYLSAVGTVSYGHPLAVESEDEPLPELDFGPLINDAKAKELSNQVSDAIVHGGIPLYQGSLDHGRFLPGQQTSAYMAPAALLNPPPSSPLFHAEPFGPVDTIVVVDTEAELVSAMNASNGALVATISCDDEATAHRLAEETRAFKVGVNKPRSRGDREEVFGGEGASWRGAFVGGELLVHAVTRGPERERLPGNFPHYTLHPRTPGRAA